MYLPRGTKGGGVRRACHVAKGGKEGRARVRPTGHERHVREHCPERLVGGGVTAVGEQPGVDLLVTCRVQRR